MTGLRIRELQKKDTVASSTLHREVLGMEFLARCGPRFLCRYHKAWIESPAGLALAAVDEHERVVGVVLGALVPGVHFRTMVRRHGLQLAFWLGTRAITHPAFARELLATRFLRYTRGIARILFCGASPVLRRRSWRSPGGASRELDAATPRPAPGAPSGREDSATKKGEITHLMVMHDLRGTGVGRELLEEARRAGQREGLDEFVLVTPPDLAARGFYEHLGWRFTGTLTSRSGESFVRYRLPLGPSPG